MVETDDLPILFVNNFYGDDENSNRRKELWSLDIHKYIYVDIYRVYKKYWDGEISRKLSIRKKCFR